jgi:hypothetical protein
MSSSALLKGRRFPDRTVIVRGRRVLRTGPRDARIVYGPLPVLLRQHRDGSNVRYSEVRKRPWLWASSVVGVLVCTPRGSVLVQFRRWGV